MLVAWLGCMLSRRFGHAWIGFVRVASPLGNSARGFCVWLVWSLLTPCKGGRGYQVIAPYDS